jgi:hypothetical protein
MDRTRVEQRWIACQHEGCGYEKDLRLGTDEEARALKETHEFNTGHRDGWWEYYPSGVMAIPEKENCVGRFVSTGPVS